MKLYQTAKLVRSKNAGPFTITFDIIFTDHGACHLVRAGGRLDAELFSRLYRVPRETVRVYWIEALHAVKVSIPRPSGSAGGPADADVYGCQWYAPLVELEVAPDP